MRLTDIEHKATAHYACYREPVADGHLIPILDDFDAVTVSEGRWEAITYRQGKKYHNSGYASDHHAVNKTSIVACGGRVGIYMRKYKTLSFNTIIVKDSHFFLHIR